jgi:putative aminopeptidase FrvX
MMKTQHTWEESSMTDIRLIEELSNAYGAPGFEDDVVDVVIKHKGNLKAKRDNLKNLYLFPENFDESKPTLMLDAHLDEVAFMVSYIDVNGLLGIEMLGRWEPYNVSAHLFVVRNKEGKYIKGVVGSKPPHFLSDEERGKAIKMDDLKLDVGATSRQEVVEEFGIEVGAPIVPSVQFDYNDQNGTMLGKAFDNRLGCAAVIETLKALENEDLAVNVVGALASQEEVGLRGATVTAQRINPTLAIVFEGTPSDDYAKPIEQSQGRMGFGPQVRHRDSSYIANEEWIKLAKKVGAEKNIPMQHAVRKGGGTNAGRIHINNLGVPVMTLGVPSRYAHTHHLFASFEDFTNTVKLATESIKAIGQTFLDQFEIEFD